MMSWGQHLVNSQVEVNRAVFEMNKPINRNGKEWEREEPRPAYITERIKEAIRDLTMALREIEQQKTIQFDD